VSGFVCTVGAVVCVFVLLCGTWRCVVPCDRTDVVHVFVSLLRSAGDIVQTVEKTGARTRYA
jgi:hypothetical protein